MRKIIFPYSFLTLLGVPCCLMVSGGAALICYDAVTDFENEGIAGIVFAILYSAAALFLQVWMGRHLFVMLYANQNGITLYRLFLPSVKLQWEEVQYVAMRTFKEGNVMYGRYIAVDAYKFILLSSSPLPQKRIDKIRSSRKKKIIKFPVTQKLCQVLVDQLPETKSGPFRYQLYLYKKAKK